MNGFQKTVKYIAFAFAMFLAVSIIAGCSIAVLKIATGINTLAGSDWFDNNNILRIDENGMIHIEINENQTITEEDMIFGTVETQSFVKTFTADEAAKVRKLNINNYSGRLTVIPGAQLQVDAKNVTMQYVAEIRNGNTLYLGRNGDVEINIFNFSGINMKQPEIILTIPVGMEFEDVDLNTGSGAVSIQEITADGIYLLGGSGKVTMRKLNTKDEIRINSGSGSVEITDVTSGKISLSSGSGRVSISNGDIGDVKVNSGSGSVTLDAVNVDDLSLDTGSGRVEFKNGRILGDIEIDGSSGGVLVQANADINDYNVDCSVGSGGAWINGVKIGDDYRSEADSAHRKLSIDGGSGRVSVELYRK